MEICFTFLLFAWMWSWYQELEEVEAKKVRWEQLGSEAFRATLYWHLLFPYTTLVSYLLLKFIQFQSTSLNGLRKLLPTLDPVASNPHLWQTFAANCSGDAGIVNCLQNSILDRNRSMEQGKCRLLREGEAVDYIGHYHHCRHGCGGSWYHFIQHLGCLL